jgi:hypothetical protein
MSTRFNSQLAAVKNAARPLQPTGRRAFLIALANLFNKGSAVGDGELAVPVWFIELPPRCSAVFFMLVQLLLVANIGASLISGGDYEWRFRSSAKPS